MLILFSKVSNPGMAFTKSERLWSCFGFPLQEHMFVWIRLVLWSKRDKCRKRMAPLFAGWFPLEITLCRSHGDHKFVCMKCSLIHVSFCSLSEHYFHQLFRLVFDVNNKQEHWKEIPKNSEYLQSIMLLDACICVCFLFILMIWAMAVQSALMKRVQSYFAQVFQIFFTSGTTIIMFQHIVDIFHFRSAQLHTLHISDFVNFKFSKFRQILN